MKKFEWDTVKSEETFAERGIDFAFAARLFDGAVVEVATPRDGEDRVKATGLIDGKFFTVVYMMRGEFIRIISARRAWDSEERKYRSVYSG